MPKRRTLTREQFADMRAAGQQAYKSFAIRAGALSGRQRISIRQARRTLDGIVSSLARLERDVFFHIFDGAAAACFQFNAALAVYWINIDHEIR